MSAPFTQDIVGHDQRQPNQTGDTNGSEHDRIHVSSSIIGFSHKSHDKGYQKEHRRRNPHPIGPLSKKLADKRSPQNKLRKVGTHPRQPFSSLSTKDPLFHGDLEASRYIGLSQVLFGGNKKYEIPYPGVRSSIEEKLSEILNTPEILAELQALSPDEKIQPEIAFEIGRVVGAFNPYYSRRLLLAMLRALRVAYREMDQAMIPVYLREVMGAFESKGISLESAAKEIGAEILLYDHWPTDSEMAALTFSLAMKPDTKAHVVILSEAEGQTQSYLDRLDRVKDVRGQSIEARVGFTHAKNTDALSREIPSIMNDLTVWLSPKIAARYGKKSQETALIARNHIVVTMEEGLAAGLRAQGARALDYFDLIKRIHYAKPEWAFQYSAMQTSAVALTQRRYEELSRFEQRVLEERSPGLYVARYNGIETSWQEAWLIAEARILQTFAQAA